MEETQFFKQRIITALNFLPLESLKLLAEFADFLRMKAERFKQPHPEGDVSKQHPLLQVAGTWEGDDFEDCLEQVYQFRGKAQF